MKTDSKHRVAPETRQVGDAVTTRKSKGNPASRVKPDTEFGRSLRDILGETVVPRQVNEEELFAASAHQLIKNRFGEQTAADFKSAFRLNMTDKPDGERYPSAERSAKEALKFFVKSSLMTKEEAQEIRQTAFQLAQLDDNKKSLWDSWGDTRAVASIGRGERLVQGRLEASGNAPVVSSGAARADNKAKTVAYKPDKPRTEAVNRSSGRSKTPKIAQEA